MLSLTKKSDEPVAAPLWHTNFRNFDRLPDTKVVRTTFFINTAAIAVTVGLLLWAGHREYTNFNLREQTAAAQKQVQDNKKQNADAIRLSKVFLDEEKKLNEVEAFIKVPITPAVFVDLIGQTLPKDISIDFVEGRIGDAKITVFQIKGRVAGSPDQASGIASSYLDLLRAHDKIGKIFDPISLNRLEKDAAGGFMIFDISLAVKTEKK